jgi:hypothetical protein
METLTFTQLGQVLLRCCQQMVDRKLSLLTLVLLASLIGCEIACREVFLVLFSLILQFLCKSLAEHVNVRRFTTLFFELRFQIS